MPPPHTTRVFQRCTRKILLFQVRHSWLIWHMTWLYSNGYIALGKARALHVHSCLFRSSASCSFLGIAPFFRWRRRCDNRYETGDRTAFGRGRDNELPSLSKAGKTAVTCRASLVVNQAFDSFPLSIWHLAMVMSTLMETRDLSLVCQKNHKVKLICHSSRRKYVKKSTVSDDNYKEFSLDNFSKEECIEELRVEKNEPVLADALGVPPVFRCSERSVFDRME